MPLSGSRPRPHWSQRALLAVTRNHHAAIGASLQNRRRKGKATEAILRRVGTVATVTARKRWAGSPSRNHPTRLHIQYGQQRARYAGCRALLLTQEPPENSDQSGREWFRSGSRRIQPPLERRRFFSRYRQPPLARTLHYHRNDDLPGFIRLSGRQLLQSRGDAASRASGADCNSSQRWGAMSRAKFMA